VKTAYWNHTPLLLVTPQAANKTIGQGGFQEMEQMNLFADCVAYQEEVRDPSRIAETLNRVIMQAYRASAPAQINVPRDFWTQVVDIELPVKVEFERPAGGQEAIKTAAELLSSAKFPVILNGAGVVLADGIDASAKLAETLDAPVCVGYQHNDAFPGNHPLFAGPLGYNGSKAGMELISKADVVLALGTRLNPFSTLPGYGIDYWPTGAKIIQVDLNPDRIGLTKNVTVGIVGDAKKVAEGILSNLGAGAGDAGRADRKNLIATTKSAWAQELTSLDHEEDDPGTTWNERARDAEPQKMSPRMAWRAIQAALPKDAIISSDIGNNCAISMNEMVSVGRGDWPPMTMIIFRNYQWGAEKRNTTLWFDDNFVGTELDTNVSYAKIADACGLTGVQVATMDELTDALDAAVKGQMKDNKTTFIEVLLNKELGEPFRRDAMKKPVKVAGVSASDMAAE